MTITVKLIYAPNKNTKFFQLRYKADKNRLQLGLRKSPHAENYSFIKHKTKVTLKIV